VGAYNGPDVPVQDIRSFSAHANGNNVDLTFEISNQSSCIEDAGVYIADTPMGPARLIGNLADEPILDLPNSWVDSFRLPVSDHYCYWLGYECGLADEVTDLSLLYPASSEFPVTYQRGAERPVKNAPGVPAVSDVLLDFGRSVRLTWDLSNDDASLDGYGIYRTVYTLDHAAIDGPRFVTLVPPGTSTYVDDGVSSDYRFSYRISSAHHGGFTIQDGDGNFAIWNDFCAETPEMRPVNNFYTGSLLISDDTLCVCPKGDGDSLRVMFTVLGSDGSPTADVSAGEMALVVYRGEALFCEGDTVHATRSTDSNGTTEFAYAGIGGCDDVLIAAQVRDTFVTGLANVSVRSPDLDANGTVALPDFSRFAGAYPSSCGDPAYCTCADFNLNCHIRLDDLSVLAFHYCVPPCTTVHACGVGGSSMATSAWGAPAAEVPEGAPPVRPAFEIGSAKERRLEDGRISLPVSVKAVSSLLACHVVIRYDGSVTSAEFVPTDYLHEPLVIPARVDDAKKTIMVALAATGGVVTGSAQGVLGALVVEGTIVPHSIQIVEAAILDGNRRLVPVVESGVLASGGTASEELAPSLVEIRETKLYQSYPNPSNPVTTISFSLKDRCAVTLRIFDVSGHIVRTLVSEELDPDVHRVIWDGRDQRGTRVSSGIYFYRLEAGGFVDQKKLVVLK
jgi:hypothetical protein